MPEGQTIASANEIRLPVGERVEFSLKSDDVIHSFWIPALGGKIDMIPGRTTRLSLLATKSGTYRAPCAEYCGTSHALMAFAAVAMERGEFDSWIASEARPSVSASVTGELTLLVTNTGGEGGKASICRWPIFGASSTRMFSACSAWPARHS